MTHPTTPRTLAALDEALATFGSYAYEDRGPSEVMGADTLAALESGLRAAGVPAGREVLLALGSHPHGERLRDHLVMVFVEDDTWPELTSALVADPSTQHLVHWLV